MSGVLGSNFLLSPSIENSTFCASNVCFSCQSYLSNNKHIGCSHAEILVGGWVSCGAHAGNGI